jgi:Domain of unknown function (DUF4082)/Bacterial Ig-like domain
MSRLHQMRIRALQWVFGCLVLCGIVLAVLAPRGASAVLNPPPGGPILVITSPSSTFGMYYGEILRNEGLNSFATADIDSVTPTTLAAYDVVVLAKAALTPAQVTMFTNWVNAGGNLIAMAPDAQLAPLLGLSPTGTTLAEGYLQINTAAAPGAGLVGQTMQYHGSADRYALAGATSVATLYSNAATATTNPAVSLRTVGSGSASAFTYDLATSVVYTRQGNPAWAAQERDGSSPIRGNDKFFGNASSDPQPDWVDLTKLGIPQADEQQRLLANLIIHVTGNKKPLPRFWYFPHGKKAVVLMSGDDHGGGGTAGRFDQLAAASPPGCSVADWECLRGTSYVYPGVPLTDAQASAYTVAGFEVGLHITTGCSDFTAASLQTEYATQLAQWQAKFPSLASPATQRHHCFVWSDWTSAAQTQLANGMRLDTTYTFWPSTWLGTSPGLFTGSAMPMRFAGANGSVIDVYQAVTQMTDESNQSYPSTIDTHLDRALGPEGYYGVFTINANTDSALAPESSAVIDAAKARAVPVVSARQMLNWLDGRNASSFGSFTWNGSTLGFTIAAGVNTNGIQAMLPLRSGGALLRTITRAGTPVSFSTQTIKGVDYAFFSGIGGSYAATYAGSVSAAALPTEALLTVADCPCGAWDNTAVPGNPSVNDPAAVELGVKFTTDVDGFITGVRFYKGAGNTGTHIGNLWTSSGQLLASATFSGETATGWQQVSFAAPVAVTANTVYIASYFAPNGRYAGDNGFFSAAGVDNGPVNLLQSGVSGPNGVYQYGATSSFPSQSFGDTNYWVDVVFTAPVGPDTTPPVASSTSPISGATGVAVNAVVSVTFNEPIDPATVSASTFELRNAANALVASSVSYNASTRTATLTPSAALPVSTSFTATVRGGATDPRIKDAAGNALAANASWSFTTASSVPGSNCPCSAWPSTAVPGNASASDTGAVELGVKFRTDIDGFITGVRFYKGTGNSGTHIGNLWTSSGQLLATATFTGESASGWQQVSFGSPVAVTANTVYVASYFAPNGRYAADTGFFGVAGVDNGPVHLLRSGVSGPNGVYQYGVTSSFPSLSFADTNYWVDVVFATSVGPDTTPPVTSSTSPLNGATGVSVSAAVSVTFNEPIDPATVSASTFELRNAANALVASSVSYNASTRTATLTPSAALPVNATFTATVRGGGTDPRIKDIAGNALAINATWSFTTETGVPGSSCPCSAWPGTAVPNNPSVSDTGAVELGVKFRTDLNGYITGVRFYKGAANTGTHIGNLWTSSGQLLATATFTSESASGWQQVSFATPVAVTANTVYIASYFAPSGRYAGDGGFFTASGVDNGPVHLLRSGISGPNGVYQYGAASTFPAQSFGDTNYWVDVVFATSVPPDNTPPAVSSTTPVSGASGVSVNSAVSVTFNESIDPATVSASTFELRNAANSLVAASISYNIGTRTATLTPSTSLPVNTTLTATVRGGASDPRIKDISGNALPANVVWSFTTGAPSGACASPANAVVAENCLPGQPPTSHSVGGAGDPTIQGYATQISVNRGTTVQFKVATTASAYRIDIYRLGYYSGAGARKVATVLPSATLPQSQPSCLSDAATGLVDCGNWAVSGSWAVPASAVSGIYLARLVRNDNNGASHIPFIVRDDASTSNILFKTSDTTWQAYNDYGGNSLYTGSPAGRAYKVSYNRPMVTRGNQYSRAYLFGAEYPMVRWLEANGYDLSYFAGVDVERSSTLLSNHRVLLSVGHDEYWSAGQRAAVETARNNGVNLAFFSGNEMFWKTRWENSIDGSATAYRTLVSYKETHANAKIDPTATWTGTWRDPRFSPPADGGRPENALTGTIFTVNCCDGSAPGIQVPAEYGNMRLWRNTSIATLGAGQVATLAQATLGYEWDEDLDNGFRPPGLFRMSSTTIVGVSYIQDFGSTYASGTATHSLTMYRHSSGARVFGAGTIRWSWGLDTTHDPDPSIPGGTTTDSRMQQATVNLLADMNSQPGSLQAGLVAATASTDASAPSSAISAPAAGATVAVNAVVTISGTAADTGGVVGGVEVSVDGGTTWRRAEGRTSWSYSWTPTAAGAVTIRSRAVDDSGNLQGTPASVSVTVGTGGGGADTTPPTISARSPASAATGVSQTANVTVTFNEAMDASTISTGTFELRDAANALVSATVTYDAATRVATLNPTPTLAVQAVYSVRVRGGGTDPRVKDVAGNALVADSIWSFTTSGDATPPTISARSPTSGATGVSRTANVTVTFNEAMDAATISASTIELRDPANALIAAVVSYSATTRVATLNPTPTLAALTAYTVTVRSGASGVKDLAGNALAADAVWSFTTVVDTTAPTVSSISPASGATGVLRNANILATFNEDMDPATINGSTFELRGPGNVLVAAVVTYTSSNRRATLNPNADLAAATTYTATVRGGTTDPRVKDGAGNALAANRTWSFTTQ